MKMYNKNELHYKNGMLVANNGEVVGIDNEIVDLANHLETVIQESQFLANQPTCKPIMSLDSFKRKSETEIDEFTCDTPILDAKMAETLLMMDEIDNQNVVDNLNEELDRYKSLILFAKDDSVVSAENSIVHKFDVPTMGNPLDWTEEKIMEFLCLAHGMNIDNVIEETVANDGEQK